MKNNILVFGSKEFNNSLEEIKDYFNISLIFYDENNFSNLSSKSISLILVDSEVYENTTILSLINKMKNKPLLLLGKQNTLYNNKSTYIDILSLPLNLLEISNKIKNLIITKQFIQNSSVTIKEYIVDKNEKKIKKKNLSLIITEREIQLIELLCNSDVPLSKKKILKTIWKYADDTDTHTVETHIYRLRKKILNKFKDENFIINSKMGYSI